MKADRPLTRSLLKLNLYKIRQIQALRLHADRPGAWSLINRLQQYEKATVDNISAENPLSENDLLHTALLNCYNLFEKRFLLSAEKNRDHAGAYLLHKQIREKKQNLMLRAESENL